MAIDGNPGVKNVGKISVERKFTMAPQPSRPNPVDTGIRPASNPKSEKPFARSTPGAAANVVFGAAHNGRGRGD